MSELDELLKALTESERQELVDRLLANAARTRPGTVEERLADVEEALYTRPYRGYHHRHCHSCGRPW